MFYQIHSHLNKCIYLLFVENVLVLSQLICKYKCVRVMHNPKENIAHNILTICFSTKQYNI